MKYTHILTLAWLTAACGGASVPPPSHARIESADDELSRYRGVLAQAKANAFAKGAASDLERAEEWLETAKTIASSNGSSTRLRLYLDAVRAQLVMVKSYYAREEAKKSAGIVSQDESDDASAKDAQRAEPSESNGDDL